MKATLAFLILLTAIPALYAQGPPGVGASYREKTSGFTHSPILGWAQDGYPIYGPYGYSDPTNPASPVKRVASSYQLRSITARTSLPTWSLPNHTGISQQLTSTQYGPPVSTAYPLGRYLEDYDYIAGLGDLDQCNGRTTVTPDFPNGTYAYFITLDSSGNPAFPCVLAGQYHGVASAARKAARRVALRLRHGHV
jgi:hypothetical protein